MLDWASIFTLISAASIFYFAATVICCFKVSKTPEIMIREVLLVVVYIAFLRYADYFGLDGAYSGVFILLISIFGASMLRDSILTIPEKKEKKERREYSGDTGLH